LRSKIEYEGPSKKAYTSLSWDALRVTVSPNTEAADRRNRKIAFMFC
jgi:hypothetical protein